VDDDLEENLASFARLTPTHEHEIVFGVASPDDPAVVAATRFLATYPHIRARLVVTNPNAALNPKVAQLVQLADESSGDIIVVSDSNVRVPHDYIRDVISPLADPQCGLVTSLITGSGEEMIGAALDNLQLAAAVAPSVVLSTLSVPATVGKSMALRRRDLDRLGGFASFGDVLAEDAWIGMRIAALNMRIATSFVAITNRNARGTIARAFGRHARWAKIRRSLCPFVFACEPLFSPILVATIIVVAMPADLSVTAPWLVASTLLQTITAATSLWALRGRLALWSCVPCIEILRTLMIAACWLNACVSRTVDWRGNTLTIGRATTLHRNAAGFTRAGASRPQRSEPTRRPFAAPMDISQLDA